MKARCLPLVLLLFACSQRKPAPTSSPSPTSTSTSASERICRQACNGDWGPHGRSQRPTCVCRTLDGGQTCRSGDDCHGDCILGDPVQTEVVEPGPPARGHFVGKCSEFVMAFGCLRRLPKGGDKAAIVDLSVLPALSCVD